ncbi:two-component sensor histidine kinase [Streptomyces sp. AV19]|uniref:sensor histidine kinase n=1 Tax=Streptomyces sp. AV19 TaxID=2793068 RepID=UPI0018FE5718|nr:histidine kinase [Streptomyces sp. AV19]MBH1933697.1 two-component sensor histidine kinase [Streptomyces sp. AV19]MDG4535797.1 histidine kinase [Streptomyces sp. AV19]
MPRLLPHRDDLLIAAAGLTGGLALYALGLSSRPVMAGLPGRLALLALAVMVGAELLRRRKPLLGLAVGTPALALDLCSGNLTTTTVMFTDLVYAAVMYGPPAAYRLIPRACEVLTVAGMLLSVALIRRPEAVLIGLALAVVTIAPAWTGVGVRRHRDAAEAARLAAERTVLLAEMDRRQAVGTERARMARELHDLVAGHLSAIAIHSTAALSINEEQASREALGVIRENSVQGLAEMRRLIGLLRKAGDTDEPAPTPTLDGLDALLERARATAGGSGFRFELRDGRGPGPLSAPVELAAYRVVQESLTNAVKHAAPGEVTVELTRDMESLTVRVTSPLDDDGRSPRAPGSHAGLIGMRERVALLGGEFEAGAENGHWQVRAVLPVDEEGK